MVQRNKNLAKLQAGYLFPEINRRKNEFIAKNPEAKIISLGIGNTTEPLQSSAVEAIKAAAQAMGTPEGYSGYGDEQGMTALREKIAEKMYTNGIVDADEVFVSDGAKCDTGRLQMLFGEDARIAVQDPSYPVYVDSAVIMGQSAFYNKSNDQFDEIAYMECTAENNFFPVLDEKVKKADVIYFCSPNNPTGAVATKEQLTELVKFAKDNKSIIIFDAAYAEFISDPSLPKSIYEIEGAKEVAIEVCSFSKPFGYTGVRLGWTVVPKGLTFDDGTSVHADWNRIMTTVFNGASNIIQTATINMLNDEGMAQMRELVDFYMENASLIKTALDSYGFNTFGGENAPYIWVKTDKMDSWEAFSYILDTAHIVTTPGAGFGPAGEGYVRFSAFGGRANILEAIERMKELKL